ncbi:exodeoxyribonuclease VII large subunit [Salipiger aestuarii]|uniref:exodeoxyribonuclease VII large subunit n=1 Tax=Salipiger aestuarii TaxID=568098 RepID=UPI00025B7961|nr:exodeoxyribonuclease VII large subunit [Salipiger aestuarii]EIE50988.1 exodeoxyribonuclease VII large subunit [Citreicella sp. 357]KAA8612135.1 exodeoxyribonuclease VII large subunit [Salipiger aestuarii]
MDLFEDGPGNTPEFSVSELSGAVKRAIEGEFGHVRVRGEVGRVSRPRSGHIYLDLKDDRSVISGVVWKGVSARLEHPPEEGMEVIATGRLTTFPGQSKYQIVIEDIRPAGVGALMATLEKRKALLAAEGLFDEQRKRPLPYLPEVIGVVTSPSGAVIRDILHRLRERFARKVLIWPVAVQGKGCAPEVVRAIEGFNRLQPGGAIPRPDLLIVARGGGSVEDLWGFNEEAVARAAAASAIPLISAVGHETDTTLIDFVSDRRAPTPTAAAEIAVPVRRELLTWADESGARMTRALLQRIETRAQRLRDLSRAMPRADTLLDGARQRLDLLSDRLPTALSRGTEKRRVQLSDRAGTLRPSLLARLVAHGRERLGRRTDRLSIRPIARDIDRAHDRLGGLNARLQATGARGLADPRNRLTTLARLLETLSYKGTLARGYAVVRSGEGHILTGKAEAEAASGLEIEFADGRFALGGSTSRPKRKTKPPEQGSLF